MGSPKGINLTAKDIEKFFGPHYKGLDRESITEAFKEKIIEGGIVSECSLPNGLHSIGGWTIGVAEGAMIIKGNPLGLYDWTELLYEWHRNWFKQHHGFRPPVGVLKKLYPDIVKNTKYPVAVWRDQIDKVRNFRRDRGYLPA